MDNDIPPATEIDINGKLYEIECLSPYKHNFIVESNTIYLTTGIVNVIKMTPSYVISIIDDLNKCIKNILAFLPKKYRRRNIVIAYDKKHNYGRYGTIALELINEDNAIELYPLMGPVIKTKDPFPKPKPNPILEYRMRNPANFFLECNILLN